MIPTTEEIMRDLGFIRPQYRPHDYGISFEEFETGIRRMKLLPWRWALVMKF